MLSITQIGGTKRTKTGKEKMTGASYYAKYLSDQSELGEPQGKFFGDGLADFGLEGRTPDLETLTHLFNGEGMDGTKLVKGNQYHRKQGYDLTFNCPKDVSVLFALASEEERRLIQQAQQNAVEKALSYLQEHATYSRIGQGGEEVVRVQRLVAATFEHCTARQVEGEDRPSVHLHTHCVIPNMVKCDDGVFRTLHPDFHRHQMSASAIHSAELAHALKSMGYAIEGEKNGFRVAGIPDHLKREWSGRRAEVLKAERVLKLDSPLNEHKRRELAATGSRKEKGDIDRQSLFGIWQAEAQAKGVALEDIRQTQAQETPEPWSVETTLAQLTHQQSTFNAIELHKAVALASIVDGSAEVIEERVRQVRQSIELVSLGLDHDGEQRFTTREVLDMERSIQDYAMSRQGESKHEVAGKAIEAAIRSRTLSEEQEAMLRHCGGVNGVVAVQGSAGAGKSYSLGAAREAFETSGYRVLGCSLSAVASQNLQEGSGIQSGTIHRLLLDIENGREALNANSIVVIDEAGTADTRLIHRLIEAANGAKLIFVGDTAQLEAIGLSFFRNLQQSIGCVELVENRRQRDERDREAVSEFRAGNVTEALSSYAERGLLAISDDSVESQDRLIDDWNRDREAHGDLGIILAGTNRECVQLNELARERLKEAGALGYELAFLSEHGEIDIAVGDRVLFTKNDIRLGVTNGTQATVLSVKENLYIARLDSGETVTIDPEEYGHFKHSYAITTHKAQGQSVSRAYVHSSGRMLSKELGYVQLTRAKDMTRIYCDKESLGELAMDELTRRMERSQGKKSALDYLRDQQQDQ